MRAKEYNTEFMQKQNTTPLKHFQNFLYRNFSKYEKKKDILPISNQPTQLYARVKTHKFDDINDITVESLKSRPIIAQNGPYMYKIVQVISASSKSIYENNN